MSDQSVSTFAKALRSCNGQQDLSKARQIHAELSQSHLCQSRFLQNLVVEMYGKCGSIDEACQAFEKIQHRNTFSWSCMIMAYAQSGHFIKALSLFNSMTEKDTLVWNTALLVCTKFGKIFEAKTLFDKIPVRDVVSWNTMLSAYARRGHIDLAEALFDSMPCRSVSSWNTMIVTYKDTFLARNALAFFVSMDQEGFQPNKITFVAVLDACAQGSMQNFGRLIHEDVCSAGLEFDVPIGTALVKMYGNYGDPEQALNLFHRMPVTNSITWNTAMTILAGTGNIDEAYKLLQEMPQATVTSWNVFLAACSSLPGQLHRARQVFEEMGERDVVSWTTMISVYSRHGFAKEAMVCFARMDLEGTRPDKIALMAVVESCGSLSEGKLVDQEVVSSEMESDVELAAALIELFGKCGSLQDARRVFERARGSSSRSNETNLWNCLLAASARDDQAIALFRRMLLEGIPINETTLVAVFDACCVSSSSLRLLRDLQETVVRRASFAASDVVETALVRTYGKMGSLSDAAATFREFLSSSRNLVSWTVVTAIYAQLGHPGQALGLCQEMLLHGILPDDTALTTVLAACSHSGLLDESFRLFGSMETDFGVETRIEHYVCVIDLLGRTGQLREAELLMSSSRFARLGVEANDRAWTAFLGACRDFGDVSRGATAAKQAFHSDPTNAGPYMLLSDVCLGSRSS